MLIMIYIANFAFVIFEPDIPAMPVAKDGTPVTQDSMECAPSRNVTSMSRSAKGMSLKTNRDTKYTDSP